MSDALLGIAEVLGDKREEILAIAAHHGASNIRAFGSVAHRSLKNRFKPF